MHQHPRPSPVTASPASSPRTNPTRTNNPRDDPQSTRSRASSDMPGYSEGDEGSEDSGVIAATGPSRDAVKKLDQIIQNFHTKAAIVVLQSRMSLPVILTKDGPKRVNKWFQIETDDTPAFRDDLSVWRNCGGLQNRPPPLILETYLDTSALESNHTLVIVDDNGKQSNVLDALNDSSGSSEGDSRRRKRNTEVILERWRIELKENSGEMAYDFAATLPTIYKKCIVFFRSLYSTSKFTPAWRFVKILAKSEPPTDLLRVKCRILSGDVPSGRFDALTHPLFENGGPVTTDYFLGTTDTPVGQISAEVSYRNDCNFRVDDADGVLGSRYMGANDQYFQPSIGIKHDSRRGPSRAVEVGSLPIHRQPIDDPGPIQAYGSLSTFHGDVPPRASSPISALRAAKIMGSDAGSPPVSSSLPRTRPIQTSRASLMSLEGTSTARRPSVSFQPFKAGSLSSSPGRGNPLQTAGDMPPQSPRSLPRSYGISQLTQARNRSSLTAGMPASLRGGPPVSDNVVASSTSSSPKPAPISRYSSSFTHRRGKSSFGGASKIADDDQISSGKQSLSSSIQPGSGILAEGPGGSSGSLQTDDDNISEFLKLLDSKKTLQSFERSGEASTKRTSAQLSKFQSMRESNNALTESMTSSTLLNRSSSSSSRQLSSVPPMVAATSMSASSSPGKPVSPHTPHTPAIPSRLSANSVAEYSVPRRLSVRNRPTPEARHEDVGDAGQISEGTNAIDIPTSPRPYYPHTRRSSSVAQQHRALPVDDDLGELPFGVHRSISLGADDREPPSLSALLRLGQEEAENVASPSSPSSPRLLQPAPHISESSTAMSREQSSSLDVNDSGIPHGARAVSAGSITAPYRPRLGRTGGRGMTPPQSGSYSSLIERAGASSTSERGSGRYSFTRTAGTYEADDEPLLFDMSEIGREQSRRSIEEPRGRGSVGASAADRGVYDAVRGADSGLSGRRGGRRGW
ncbi:Autophagy-related protein 13 [Venustampulla echinocandica]|uniref:Autophagy-related protein 13 n=1 Tax=Venustampulla echinocandica TaxID=2656787 RepID=A0A370TM21_9HELO|nr:Autophagy-related protein 13 [Venustampulla echinocandica]RDL36572.1 Autophagy-related protein 13 [Venustampulla echinocandica]